MEQNRPKKLVLNRETIRNLTQKDMERVEGGKGPTVKCPTYGHQPCLNTTGKPLCRIC